MNLQDVTNRLSAEDFVKLFRSKPDRWLTESLLGSLALVGAGGVPVMVLRAGIVVGDQGLSWEITASSSSTCQR